MLRLRAVFGGRFMFQLSHFYRVIVIVVLLNLVCAGAYGNDNAKQSANLASEQLAYIVKFANVAPERSREAINQYEHLT